MPSGETRVTWVDLQTGMSRVVLTTTNMAYALAWHPKGDWILFQENGILFKVHPDGSSLQAVANFSRYNS
jgi:hypothetical protein